MTSLAGLVRSFAALLKPDPGNDEKLQEWARAAQAAGLPSIQAFTRGLHLDTAAATAAVTLPFHNGRTEGVNAKTKMIKRQMYGRAGFTLLPHPARLTTQCYHRKCDRAESETEPGERWNCGRRGQGDASSPAATDAAQHRTGGPSWTFPGMCQARAGWLSVTHLTDDLRGRTPMSDGALRLGDRRLLAGSAGGSRSCPRCSGRARSGWALSPPPGWPPRAGLRLALRGTSRRPCGRAVPSGPGPWPP